MALDVTSNLRKPKGEHKIKESVAPVSRVLISSNVRPFGFAQGCCTKRGNEACQCKTVKASLLGHALFRTKLPKMQAFSQFCLPNG